MPRCRGTAGLVYLQATKTIVHSEFSFSISSASKCNESKCSESRRISSSSDSWIVSAVCELDDGRAVRSVAVVDVDTREDVESIPTESTDFGRDREGVKRSSAVSCGSCGEV